VLHTHSRTGHILAVLLPVVAIAGATATAHVVRSQPYAWVYVAWPAAALVVPVIAGWWLLLARFARTPRRRWWAFGIVTAILRALPVLIAMRAIESDLVLVLPVACGATGGLVHIVGWNRKHRPGFAGATGPAAATDGSDRVTRPTVDPLSNLVAMSVIAALLIAPAACILELAHAALDRRVDDAQALSDQILLDAGAAGVHWIRDSETAEAASDIAGFVPARSTLTVPPPPFDPDDSNDWWWMPIRAMNRGRVSNGREIGPGLERSLVIFGARPWAARQDGIEAFIATASAVVNGSSATSLGAGESAQLDERTRAGMSAGGAIVFERTGELLQLRLPAPANRRVRFARLDPPHLLGVLTTGAGSGEPMLVILDLQRWLILTAVDPLAESD
jgi:hypothetical protein